MKHLRLYENFKKEYYNFDAIDFYKKFKEIFNIEKEKHKDFSGEFFKTLDKLLPNWSKIPLEATVEQIVKDILQDKEVEFYDLAGDINNGRVKKTKFFYSVFFHEFKYSIDLYEEITPEFINVDFSKSVKIYGKPTKIEEVIDIHSNVNKYNI